MKKFFSIFLLAIGVSVACASHPMSSQSPQNTPHTASAPPHQTLAAISETHPCGLVMNQAPVIHGLRLRMTPEQILALFPGSKEDADVSAHLSRPPSKFGTTSFVIRPDKFQSKEKFAGISQISFTLLDGRVSNFTVGYEGPEWPHVDKFVEKFMEGTNLPTADAWEAYVGMDTQMKTLRCEDFETRIFAGGQGGNLNYVMMSDLDADKELKERKAKARKGATP